MGDLKRFGLTLGDHRQARAAVDRNGLVVATVAGDTRGVLEDGHHGPLGEVGDLLEGVTSGPQLPHAGDLGGGDRRATATTTELRLADLDHTGGEGDGGGGEDGDDEVAHGGYSLVGRGGCFRFPLG